MSSVCPSRGASRLRAVRDLHAAHGAALNDAAGGRDGIGATLGPRLFVSNDARRSLYVLLGAVGFLLLIVCANLANLSLSRALSRARDAAIRSSLGASRWRLVRESLATGGSAPPGSAGVSVGRLEFDGREGTSDETIIMPSFVVWPNYFTAIGLPIVDGRSFADADEDGVVIVAEGFARAHWRGESPIGKRFRWSGRSNPRWYTVIGVAAEVWLGDDDARMPHELYYPMRQAAGVVAKPVRPSGVIADWRTFTVRTTSPGLTVPALRAAVAELDPRVVVSSIDAVDHLYAEDLAMPRLMLLLMGTFAVFGLLVAAAGIYGVLSHLVAERRREFGVRVALGARPADIRRLVLRSAALLTGAGIGLGLLGAAWMMRFVRTLLYEVEATDPASLVTVVLLLGAIAGLAAWRPTHRAMRADPLSLLRDG